MPLELQWPLQRPRSGHGSAATPIKRALPRQCSNGLQHPGKRFAAVGHPWHGERSIRTALVHRLATRSAPIDSLEELQGLAAQPDVDVRAILSDPNLEGDPLQFLKVTEAYWTVRTEALANTNASDWSHPSRSSAPAPLFGLPCHHLSLVLRW